MREVKKKPELEATNMSWSAVVLFNDFLSAIG